jgi:hypothetical protein
MTDPTTTSTRAGGSPVPAGSARREQPRKPGFLPTALASVACFLVLFEFLAFQLRSGNDPALGAPQTATAPRETTLADRTLIKTRVVHDPAAASAQAPSASAGGQGGSLGTPNGAAAQAPSAAAPATTTAPAPAPPVTGSS